ncbi:MAG: CheR family methyltransferase, partial [Blastocatellia bacterium]
MKRRRTDSKLEDLEIDLLIEGIRRYYGYDFRGYKAGAVRRRVREAMLASRIST